MKKVANYNISLKVFLKNNKWEVLVLKTPDSSSYMWNYDLAWWRIDENEFYVDLLDILDREIKEEVWNIKYNIINKPVAVSRHRAEYIDHTEDIFYIFYEAEIISWNISISDEHSDYKWVILNDIILEDYFISWILDGTKMYLNKKK